MVYLWDSLALGLLRGGVLLGNEGLLFGVQVLGSARTASHGLSTTMGRVSERGGEKSFIFFVQNVFIALLLRLNETRGGGRVYIVVESS